MRKIVSVIAMAALVGLGPVALPAEGTAAGGRVRSVEFTGTSTFDFSSPDCSFAHQLFDATLTTRRGATLHIEGCTDLPTSPGPPGGTLFPFTGTFEIASGRRSITGTVTGAVGAPSSRPCDGLIPAGLDLELTPTTRRPHHPVAPLQLDGDWCSPGTPGVPGPISGTVTGALPHHIR
jgi:hypothetical protein